MAHNLDYKNPPKYKTYKERAEKRFEGDPCLTEEQFNKIFISECHYCGKEGPNGIDRIVNSIGYKSANCVPCCKHCNYVKGDLSLEDFNTWKERFIKKQIKSITK